MKTVFGLVLFVLLGASIHGQEHVVTTTNGKAFAEVIAIASNSVVKNAPFSAEAISESVQVLADGNRIVRSSSSKLYRNSEGRFRREGTGGTGSALGGFYNLAPNTMILDPVGGYRYQLNTATKTGHQTAIQGLENVTVYRTAPAAAAGDRIRLEYEAAKAAGGSNAVTVVAPSARAELIERQLGVERAIAATPALPGFAHSLNKNSKTEQLGTQNIEGVEAEGTRTVTTIEAGAIGNERPIEIVYEKWYSKELQMVVMSKNSDPRYGEQTYRLTNINRSEPDPSLFTVPQGYNITEPFREFREFAPATSGGVRTVRAVKAVKATKPQ